jgi:hypothetical protein
VAGYAEVINALRDLLFTDDLFKNQVSKHNFAEISETGSLSVVLRVGGFTSEDEAFGRIYGVTWDIFADIYQPYGQHIEDDIDELITARDTLMDLIFKNVYLGKGVANAEGIEVASIRRGEGLGLVFNEADTCTHFTLSVTVQVRQQIVVTAAE